MVHEVLIGERTTSYAKVVTESAFNENEAIFASCNSMTLAALGLVKTSTCRPSGFSSATCFMSAAALGERKRRAPRRIMRKGPVLSTPGDLMSSELMVTMPPQGNGPMFGWPCFVKGQISESD
jgi:hypothetical protein